MFGISSDTPQANKAFAEKERLPFPLLTDQSDFLRKSFGIKGDLFGMLKGRQVRQHSDCYMCTYFYYVLLMLNLTIKLTHTSVQWMQKMEVSLA